MAIKTFDKKAYMKRYRLEHREKILQQVRQYAKKTTRTEWVGYGGVCFCPRCGKKGYKYYHGRFNINTGRHYGIRTTILHKHMENGVIVFDGNCYIGMGKL